MILSSFIWRRLISSKNNWDIPRPIPIGNMKQQAEIEQLIRAKERELISSELQQDSRKDSNTSASTDTVDRSGSSSTGEINGPKGPEPTRYGDWERNGRVYDF